MRAANTPYHGLKPGDHVRLPDGSEHTVCYWFLDGVGVVPGLQDLRGLSDDELPPPEAMLREPYNSAELPCLGPMFELIED